MSKYPMAEYYDLLADILENGEESDDRTGTGTRSVFGRQMRFNLNEGFPLLTGKFTPFNLIAAELLWFLSGSTNNEELRKLNGNDRATIWEEWANSRGNLGPIYGKQWRHWDESQYAQGTDQIDELIEGLKSRPSSRRHLVSAWNASDLPYETLKPQENVAGGFMALAPCHFAFQMHVSKERRLSCHVNVRSSDTFLGLPFNIASYALLTHMVAEVTGLCVGDLIVTLGDAHIYNNHMNQVEELLSRDLTAFPLPTLVIKRPVESIDDFTMDDFTIINYQSWKAIKAPVSI